MKKILEVKNLSKFFISKFGVNNAVDNVSFDLHKGEIIGLIGQSGSGKTTIGKSLIRIFNETNGVVSLDGKIVSGKHISKDANKKIKKEMQMIFQDAHSSLNEKRNVYSTLLEPLKIHKINKKVYRSTFNDWKYIVKTQELGLKYEYYRTLKDYYTFKSNNINSFYKSLLKELKVFNCEDYRKDPASGLNNLLGLYYSDRIASNRKIIKKLVFERKHLYNFYIKTRKKLNELSDIPFDEKNLIMAKDELQFYIDGVKYNNNIKKTIKKQRMANQKKIKSRISEVRIILKAFMGDANTKIQFYKQNASVTIDFSKYQIMLSELLTAKLFKKNVNYIYKSNKIKILNSDQIFDLYISLLNRSKEKAKEIKAQLVKEYKGDLDIKNNRPQDIAKTKNLILRKMFKNQVNQSADKNLISLEKFVKISDENISQINKLYDDQLKKIKKNDAFPDSIDHVKLEKLKKKISVANGVFIEERVKFLKKWNVSYVSLLGEYKEKRSLSSSSKIREWTKVAKSLFNEKFAVLEKYILESDNDNAKKSIKILKEAIKKNSYQNKSFVYEEKLLTKSFHKLDILYGLKKRVGFLRKMAIMKILNDKSIFDMLESVGLKSEHAYRYPHEFSGGQKQRISIARALVVEPSVIIADEPIASLDVSIQAQVINILMDLVKKNNISMIFIGHDLSTIEYLADNIYVLHFGRVVERGNVKEIFSNPIHPYTKTLLESVPKMTNANEKFRIYSSQIEYLSDYSLNNIPNYINVKKGKYHDILATNDQYKKWSKNVKKR